MSFVLRFLAAVACVVLLAVVIEVAAPKAAHGFVAALVQVVGNVLVANPSDANGNQVPLLTRDANSPVRVPFSVEHACTFPGGSGTSNRCYEPKLFVVPPGQVAKVEYASILCQVGGTPPSSVDLTTVANFDGLSGVIVDHFITPPSGGLQSNQGIGQVVSFYLNGSILPTGNPMAMLIQGDETTGGRCFVAVHGYLTTP